MAAVPLRPRREGAARGEGRLRGRAGLSVLESRPDRGVLALRFVTSHGARSEVSAAASFVAAQLVKLAIWTPRVCPSAPLIALGLDFSFGGCRRCPGRGLPAPITKIPVLLCA